MRARSARVARVRVRGARVRVRGGHEPMPTGRPRAQEESMLKPEAVTQ